MYSNSTIAFRGDRLLCGLDRSNIWIYRHQGQMGTPVQMPDLGVILGLISGGGKDILSAETTV